MLKICVDVDVPMFRNPDCVVVPMESESYAITFPVEELTEKMGTLVATVNR